MSRRGMADRVREWQTRLNGANKCYERWEDRYRVTRLEDYALGIQRSWGAKKDGLITESYIVNLCAPTLDTRLPSLLFYNPRATVAPAEAKADDPGSLGEQAKLREDVVNSFIQARDVGFKRETQLALREAHYRFGVIEVGYTGDFIDNPLAGKPMLNEKGEDAGVLEPERIPNPKNKNPESLYVRRIPANTFRVSVIANNHLPWCEWAGYYEWVRKSDIAQNPYYRNRRSSLDVKATGRMKDDYASKSRSVADDDAGRYNDCVKLWKLWDIREKKRYTLVDGADKFLVDGEPFSFLPFAVLKFWDEMDEFYPKPVMADWIHPQDELNETREQQRRHRKRFNRRWMVAKDVQQAELDKLESGEDGQYIKVPDINTSIAAIPDAPHDAAVVRNIPLTRQDFQEITATGGDQRGAADSETATQAQIVEGHSQIRTNYARTQVGEWLSEVACLMLKTIEERMTLPFWIARTVDITSPTAQQDAANVAGLYQQIEAAEDMQPGDYDVTVDVESMSPISRDLKRENWAKFLAILGNPGMLGPMLASEFILRRTLDYMADIRDERSIAEFKMAAQAIMLMASGMAQPGAAGGKQPGSVGPQPPPPDGEIVNQLAGQLGLTAGGGTALPSASIS